MITDLIWEAICGLFVGIFSVIPEWNLQLPSFPETWGATAGGALGVFDNYVPLGTLGMCLVALLGMRLAFGLWRGVVFVYHQIWGSD